MKRYRRSGLRPGEPWSRQSLVRKEELFFRGTALTGKAIGLPWRDIF